MGIVRAIQKGDVPASKFSKAAQKAAKSMDKKSVKKYAATKHDDLPKKVKEMYESILNENPAVIATAARMAIQNKQGKKVSVNTARQSSYASKDPSAHKKAKSIFQRIKDKFKKKDKPAPKKQSKSDVDFYKRQFTGEVKEGPDDVRFARRALSKIAKHEANLRKSMFELEQAFLRDPRQENQKLAKDLKKNYKDGITKFMRDSVQMIKRMK